MSLEFVKSQKGKDLLVVNDEFYRQNSFKGNKIYWLCTKERSHKCKARCITEDGKFISTGGQHSHNAMKADEAAVCKLIQNIKNEVKNTAIPPTQRMAATATHPIPNRNCCHCTKPIHLIGSKYLSETLNVVLPNKHDVPKPTILEALVLIFGFKLPISEIVMNGNSGVEYLSDGYSLSSLCICLNCESVLKNLYKLFTLFTELSNGKESFILKNSIISGRIKQNKVLAPAAPLTKGKSPLTLNSITKDLSSEVVAEVFISKSVSISAVPLLQSTPGPGAIQTQTLPSTTLTPLPNPLPPAKIFEVITIDEDDTDAQTSNSLPINTKSLVNTPSNVRKRPATATGTHNLPDANKRRTVPIPPPISLNATPRRNGVSTPPFNVTVTPVNETRTRSPTNANIANRSRKPRLPSNVLPKQTRTTATALVLPSRPNSASAGNLSKKVLYCQQCKQTFTSIALFQTHLQYHNSSEFRCDFPGCISTFYELRQLNRHKTMFNHKWLTTTVNTPTSSRPRRSSGSGDESNYWKSGVEVLNDPEDIMRKAVQGS